VYSGRHLPKFSAKSTLSMEWAGSSEMSVNFFQITWHDIAEDIIGMTCFHGVYE
jgi:hypothetical protein